MRACDRSSDAVAGLLVKILIVSDVHGNLDALDALTESCDELWVLGDLVNYGPEPAAVIQRLRQRASVIVRGNHDHAVGYDVDPRCSPAFRAMAETTRQLAMATLSEADKRFLRDLPLSVSTERDGRRFFLCHATPSDPLFAYCPPDSPTWADESAAVDADVILVGHTHLPFIKRFETRTVVNPGSLGHRRTADLMPRTPSGRTGNSCYAKCGTRSSGPLRRSRRSRCRRISSVR